MVSFRKAAFAIAVASAAVAALPAASAHASFVSVSSTSQPSIGGAQAPSLLISGAGNGLGGGSIDEPNSIRVADGGAPNSFLVTDSASPLRAAGPGCVQVDANTARCSGVLDTRFYAAFLFGGSDRIEIQSKYLARGGIIDAGAGDDVMLTPVGADGVSVGGPVRDDIVGGPGRDTISYSTRPAHPSAPGTGVVVRAADSNAFDDGQFGAEDRIRPDVENVTGTARADSITAPNQSTGAILSGLGGNDSLTGTPFADILTGASGVDVLNGLAGNDRLIGRETSGAARDELRCGLGTDTAVMDTLDASLSCEVRQRS